MEVVVFDDVRVGRDDSCIELANEIGFGRITDSPEEAVDLIVRSLPSDLRTRLKPSARS